MPYNMTFTQVNPAASSRNIIQPKTLPIIRINNMPSLFSNNSRVYYKPHTMTSGVGSVRNNRAIGIKT